MKTLISIFSYSILNTLWLLSTTSQGSLHVMFHIICIGSQILMMTSQSFWIVTASNKRISTCHNLSQAFVEISDEHINQAVHSVYSDQKHEKVKAFHMKRATVEQNLYLSCGSLIGWKSLLLGCRCSLHFAMPTTVRATQTQLFDPFLCWQKRRPMILTGSLKVS